MKLAKLGLLFLVSFTLSSLILIISIFRIAEIKYVFSQSPNPTPVSKDNISINYSLPEGGKIEPDNLLWPLKALRDKILLVVTINPAKKADLYLMMSDKRLVYAKSLLERRKPDLAVSVLTKGEKYLELAHAEERIARQKGMNTNSYLNRFAIAALKHREVIDDLISIAPEDAKPIMVKSQDYSKNLYNEARNNLLEAGLIAPQNPFDSL